MEPTPDEIRTSIERRYLDLARSPELETEFAIGPESAKSLGYPSEKIDSLPATVTQSFAGVGCPFSIGELHAGETVLDVGCGAGMDSILAGQFVSPSGRAIGVDSTQEMVDKARRNADESGVANAEFRQADAANLPVASNSVDVVISNGVFNLCLDKPRVIAEILRVLRRGGRLYMADIMLESHVTPEKVQLLGSWSG
jgi:SAM-dependent methyltransferase